uniref:Chaperone protein dnaJ 1 n=1 Tax=Rhizophora mucronata TaxID=61149 RepID=A0A2P2L3H0_RHIMU
MNTGAFSSEYRIFSDPNGNKKITRLIFIWVCSTTSSHLYSFIIIHS